MTNNLYMVWNDSYNQEEPILDEQHRALLATINSLHYFLQQGQGLEALMPTIKILIAYIRFHNKTEEGVLYQYNYPELEQYIHDSEQQITDFKAVCRKAISTREPELVMQFLKKWWESHLELHYRVSSHVACSSGHYCRVQSEK